MRDSRGRMSEGDAPMVRPSVPDAERLIGVKHPVLSHGYVVLVDYMGNDAAIVQAARVSYGAGTKSVRDDRGLIRYLMRHRHTTPFEMVEFKFLARLPIYVARQWIRHRTACLAEGTRVHFDRPDGLRHGKFRQYSLKIEDIWRRFQPAVNHPSERSPYPSFGGDQIRSMLLRHLDEETRTIEHTRVADVTRNGPKPVFRMILEDGKWIDCTADHRFLFSDGWKTLAQGTGLHEVQGQAIWDGQDLEIAVNGTEVTLPAHGQGTASTDHDDDGETRSMPNLDRIVVARFEKIQRFEFLGERMTYDLEVEGPFHNFVANGIITHNSVNEYSARYSMIPDEFDLPAEGDVRRQSVRSRQGRAESLPPEVVARFREDLERVSREAYEAYSRALESGVARETARLLLPVSYYTQWYWKINLYNLFHFLSLRLDPHAQDEIRLYAAELAKIARAVCPVAFEAFEEFQLEGMSLGRRERTALRSLLDGATPEKACADAGLPLTRDDGKPMATGEGVEFLEKLDKIRSKS
jgi:flavin-dependent thymidylate synthase